MKLGVCVPAFNYSAEGFNALVESLNKFTPEGYYLYSAVPDEPKIGGNILSWRTPKSTYRDLPPREQVEKLLDSICNGSDPPDIVAFLDCTCLVSAGWYHHIKFHYMWNENVVMCVGSTITAQDLLAEGMIGALDAFRVDFQNDGNVLKEHLKGDWRQPKARPIHELTLPWFTIRTSYAKDFGIQQPWINKLLATQISTPPIITETLVPEVVAGLWPYGACEDSAVEATNIIPFMEMSFPVNVEYDTLKDINLGHIHYREEWQKARMKWIGERCGSSVLDVGCATGELTRHVVDGTCYTGIDFDRNRIDQAKKTTQCENSKFYVIDATYGLPWQDKEFETVVCAEVLEHMPKKMATNLLFQMLRAAANNVVITLPLSDRMHKNVDHVWYPTPGEIKELWIDDLPSPWVYDLQLTEDFILLDISRAK